MGGYRMPSATPSVDPDAPTPKTLQDEDSAKPQIPPGTRTRRLSQAFSEAEQTVAKRPKTVPKTYTEDENIPADNAPWVFFVGNLHPRTTPAELYELFKDSPILDIVIRSARGCGVTVIPDEAMGPSDRCYASIEVKGFAAAWDALHKFDPKNPPILHGLPLVIKLCAADMPEVPEMLERTMGSQQGTKSKRTKRRTRKRIAVEKTELVIEDQPRPLAGPSKRKA